MNFPYDRVTYEIDEQFMWGEEFMVVPVLEEGAQTVTGYFPKATWYHYYNEMEPVEGPKFAQVNAPLTQIPLFFKGGSIVPLQRNESTTHQSRLNPFFLRLYLPKECNKDSDGNHCDVSSRGELIVDDGESPFSIESSTYTHVIFRALHNFGTNGGNMTSEVVLDGYEEMPKLTFVSIHGIGQNITEVKLAGHKVHHFQDSRIDMVGIPHLQIDLKKPFTLQWV